mgnify:CR=1 FL=1|jgi:hypothetical protein
MVELTARLSIATKGIHWLIGSVVSVFALRTTTMSFHFDRPLFGGLAVPTFLSCLTSIL